MNAIGATAAALAAALALSACGGTPHHVASQQAVRTTPTASATTSSNPVPGPETKLCNRFSSDFRKYRGEPVQGSTIDRFASQLGQLSHAARHDYQDARLANELGDASKWLPIGWHYLQLANEGDTADKVLSTKYGHKALHAIQTAYVVCLSNGA
ncbi:MAG: hypothetical protein LBV34_15715 [Nocardiopsaceae bacterium]|jgi:hypothetical protein|nr:hypothetical protein [Nocardiopsaceae bacterium]